MFFKKALSSDIILQFRFLHYIDCRKLNFKKAFQGDLKIIFELQSKFSVVLLEIQMVLHYYSVEA